MFEGKVPHKGLARFRWRHCIAFLLGTLALLCVSGCQEVLSLQPKGPAAAQIADLWWFQFFLALPFVLAVIVILLLAIRRHRRKGGIRDSKRGMTMIIWGGAILPAMAMFALLAYTVDTLVDVTRPAEEAELSIEVQGEIWWWRIGYTDGEETIYTANEIHIPAGEPVALELTSDNVIHSLWVPELHGKRDMIPGITSKFWIQADQPGTFHGQCAEFCGAQHAKMHFLVIAHEQGEYLAWAEKERQPAQALEQGDPNFSGQQVFLQSGCASCHTIRGTGAMGTLGPDLTHVDNRRNLAAGTLSNVTGNLAAWIVDSQQFKPGNLMPPMSLDPDDLLGLVDYLQTLN